MEASPTRRRRPWLWGLAAIPVVLGGLAWYFTEPLSAPSTARLPEATGPDSAKPIESGPVPWPADSLEGEAAKKYLLTFLEAAEAKLNGVAGYTATFHKQERLRGKLGVEQTLRMKVRHKPFSIYFKYVTPTPGREILYVDGKHENKLIAHSTDLAGLLLPRLPIDPTSSLALADNRHPITEAGLANLTTRLLGFRRLDLSDSDAKTILDRYVDPNGRTWLRSLHLHEHQTASRPFQRIEVLYDPETKLPHQITSYDWPVPGASAELKLAEKYTYDDVKLDAPLTDIDFDLANPAYAFRRF